MAEIFFPILQFFLNLIQIPVLSGLLLDFSLSNVGHSEKEVLFPTWPGATVSSQSTSRSQREAYSLQGFLRIYRLQEQATGQRTYSFYISFRPSWFLWRLTDFGGWGPLFPWTHRRASYLPIQENCTLTLSSTHNHSHTVCHIRVSLSHPATYPCVSQRFVFDFVPYPLNLNHLLTLL